VPTLDEVQASFLLTIWLVLVSVTSLRMSVAGLFAGRWWRGWKSRVDRSEPAASVNQAMFGRRLLELLLALALGWIPGLALQSVLGPGDPTVDTAFLTACSAGAAVYLFRSLRTYDSEGRERYVARTIREGQERIDSLP
jgi:hypothetical protein